MLNTRDSAPTGHSRRRAADDAPTGRITRFTLAAALCAGLFAYSAGAQVRDVDPYYGVVTTDRAPVRAGDAEAYYRVIVLEQGDIVRVDGEGNRWARIHYPVDAGAFLRAEEAERRSDDPDTVVLRRDSRLRAAHATSGFDGSWKSLLPEPIHSGETLELIEVVEDDSGQIRGFRVVPPDRARAFIATQNIRRATPQEVEEYRARTEETPSEGQEAEQAEPEAAEPETEEQPAEEQPETREDEPATPEIDESLIEPMTPAEETELQDRPAEPEPERTQPDRQRETPAADDDEPAVIEQGGRQPREEGPPVMDFDQLEAAFNAVRRQPVMEAELDELLNEFRRARNAVEDGPTADRLRTRLNQRMEVLRLSIDYRDRMRELQHSSEESRQRADEAEARAEEILSQGEFSLVGRLVPSRVYDGSRLPRMYRLVSPGPLARTLGYIEPTEELRLERVVGRTVGVAGEIHRDQDLGLRIIRARRVAAVDD